MKVALLSNVNVDIVKQCLEESSDVVYVPYGYNTWYQDILSDESDLFKFYPDLYVLLIEGNALIENSSGPEDRRTIVESEIEKIREVVQRIRGLVLIANLDIHSHHILPLSVILDDYALEGLWLEGLSEISQRYQNVCILDIKKIVCMMGTDSFYDPRVWYLGSIPYSLRASKAIAKEIGAIERAYQGKRKKCLAVDLDNTIWGGVIGEDGINGIVLGPVKEGARFMNIQKRLKELKNTGVVLAVVSKNNPEEALTAIRNHPNMILHEDDFVEILANWKPKSENIRQLSADLNIGVDAIVLLDDNPVEREEVRANLPNVMVIEPRYAKEIFDEDIVNSFAEYFPVLKLTSEDKVKTEQYRGEFRRKEVLSSSRTLEEYLERLEIHVHLRKAKNQDIDRIAQLTQKTNQFNLTSKRYTSETVRDFLAQTDMIVYVAESSDKYGSYGEISTIIIRVEKDNATVDTFLMSCRAMGRTIEFALLKIVENELYENGVRRMIGLYKPTEKNKPVEGFYEKNGYRLLYKDSEGVYHYTKELNSKQLVSFNLTIEREE